jgi:hypothetical protein
MDDKRNKTTVLAINYDDVKIASKWLFPLVYSPHNYNFATSV